MRPHGHLYEDKMNCVIQRILHLTYCLNKNIIYKVHNWNYTSMCKLLTLSGGEEENFS